MTDADQSRAVYLAGYRWALEHLTDPGVLRDAALYAEERGGHPSVDPEAPTSVEERTDGLSDRSAPRRSTESGATKPAEEESYGAQCPEPGCVVYLTSPEALGVREMRRRVLNHTRMEHGW